LFSGGASTKLTLDIVKSNSAHTREDHSNNSKEGIELKLVGIAPLKPSTIDSQKFGTSLFAVSGIPSKPMHLEVRKDENHSSLSRTSPERNLAPLFQSSVIITQPMKANSPLAANRVGFPESNVGNAVVSRSFHDDIGRQDRGVQQLVVQSASSGDQWGGRSISPTAELMATSRNYGQFVGGLNRSLSPAVDVSINRLRKVDTPLPSTTYKDRIHSANTALSGGPLEQSNKRLDFRVINPTKVLPLSGIQPVHTQQK